MSYRAMRSTQRWRSAALFVLAMAPGQLNAAWADDFRKLSDAEIKHLITGKTVTDEVHYTDRFKAGGAYEGVFMNKRSAGTWKVNNGQLCITRGSDPETCDEFWRSGFKLQRRKPGLPNVRDDVIVLSE
jgi:hypothetical protein